MVHGRHHFGTTVTSEARDGRSVWLLRIVVACLIVALAWEALDPNLDPAPLLVIASYFVLGFGSTLSFPRSTWIGVLIAVLVAIGFEVLQVLVPVRDAKWIEVIAKWLSASAGVVVALIVAYVLEARRAPGKE